MKILICVLFLLCTALPLQAYQFFQISDSPGESHQCRVASDVFTNTVVAWVEEDSGVWTRFWQPGQLDAPIYHGPGELPDLAVSDERGFVLAFVRDGAIILKEGDGSAWPDTLVYAQDAAQYTLPRLTAFRTNTWVHGVYLCWQTDLDEIRFAERFSGDWQDPEYVMPLNAWAGFAQAVAGQPEDPWNPRVFVMQDGGLEFSRRGDGGWGDPVAVLPSEMPFGGEFSVGGGGNWPAQVLSNGVPPTCPCNVMRHSGQLPDSSWSPVEDLTHYLDEYTWPMDPAIAVDEAGVLHAFWYQEHYDDMLQPSFEGMHYRVRRDGVWSDETAVFEGHVGKDTDLDVVFEYPAFTWAAGPEDQREVWLAVHPHVNESPPAWGSNPRLSAHPNPFNPRSDIRLELAEETTLVLDIHDTNGRRILRLAEGRYPAGEQRFAWEGRDEQGQVLPSGVYLAKLKTEFDDAAVKLVLLR